MNYTGVRLVGDLGSKLFAKVIGNGGVLGESFAFKANGLVRGRLATFAIEFFEESP